jgi:hypothetical protein
MVSFTSPLEHHQESEAFNPYPSQK